MISAYMVDDVIIIKYAGIDDFNEPDDTVEVPVKGKIEYKTRLMRDLKGTEVIAGTTGTMLSSAMIRFPESIDTDLGRALKHEDILKFDDVEHAILKIEKPKAFSNPIYEVYVA